VLSYSETDNVWMVCCNCESNFSIEELFSEEDTESSIECPICNSHSFRKSDSYDSDLEETYAKENYLHNSYINSEW